MLSDADQLQPHLPQFFQGQQVGRQHGFHSTTLQDLPGVQLNPQDRPKAKDFRWLARVLFPHQIHWKVIFDSMISFALSVCIQIYDRLSRLDNKIAHHSKPLSISKIKHGHRTSMENPQKNRGFNGIKDEQITISNPISFQIPYHFSKASASSTLRARMGLGSRRFVGSSPCEATQSTASTAPASSSAQATDVTRPVQARCAGRCEGRTDTGTRPSSGWGEESVEKDGKVDESYTVESWCFWV